ncbi:hypothetical protein [Pseudomonas sp.]|uniref:hypothetical protein n=1 Tax=Pseudomonas sp. TaxID=306 RepID=UPI0028AD6D28|nr:hypothetical protein [Pseudomonas sp.]
MSNVLNEDCAVLLRAISDWTSAIGISHVQRLMRWGYQRSINAVEALTQPGELVITSQGQWSRALKLSDDLPSTNPVIDKHLNMPSFPFDVSLPLPKGSDWSSLMSNMHSQLMAAYGEFKSTLPINDPFMDRLTPPLLMSVPKKWEESKKRVLVVGQETLGWDFHADSYYPWPYPAIATLTDFANYPHSVEALSQGYLEFEFAKHQPANYRGPYWRAYRQIRAALGEEADGRNTSVLTTNLFRMSLEGASVVYNGTADEIARVRELSKDLLRKEIEILKPSAVIFFTGVRYNKHLEAEFPECFTSDFHGYDQRRTSLISHPSLPLLSVRTYHPAYLQRSSNWKIIDQIIEAIIES